MSGRLTDIAVYEKEPRIMYVASASGGLWKTVNNGTTWKPVFEREKTVALGAVAVSQTDPDIVWVGTGEANARNSVSWGDGVYHSKDGGKSWLHMGLAETQHIGRVVLHPTNPDIVYVAALGHLWGANKERGVFKTTDGGKSWQHSLAIGANTGCVDLAIDPEIPDVLYAAAYQVRRDAFSGGNPATQTGPGAGLYKTSDGGKTWRMLEGGLPKRPLGRCGVCVSRQHPNVVFAIVQTDLTADTVQGQPANQKLDLKKGGVFRSDDRGATWKHLNSLVPRPFYYGQIRIDPGDEQRIYVLGVNFHVSSTGGKTFQENKKAKGTHVDYHVLWIDPRDSYRIILGCDGGLNFSYDKGLTWEHLKNLPVSQFYAIGLDMRKPYHVYGGLQDNGTWGAPSATRAADGITASQWRNILGFDGYYCQVHPRDNDLVYAEGQYGMLHRINVRTGASNYIAPRLDSKDARTNIEPPLTVGTPDFRFNWSSPILQSPYNEDELFYGGDVVFASRDRGNTWRVTSPDLSRGKPGPNAFKGHTITTLAASVLEDHLIYAGTDDGVLCVCKNWKAKVWTDLSETIQNLPQERWITRVEASRFDKGTVYLSVDRHRQDDRKPYLYVSTDYGLHWVSLAGNLPRDGPVHVIREDPVNPDLLYAGTEFGLFVSFDRGKSWHKQLHLPTVPVHDLVVHPRDRELVIATHGRGIWIMDVLPLQELTMKIQQKDAHLCTIRTAVAFRPFRQDVLAVKQFVGENPAYGAGIYYYIRAASKEEASVTIFNDQGKQVARLKTDRTAGLHRASWNLNHAGTKQGVFYPLPAGAYTAVLQVGERKLQQTFQIEVDD
jgi:photosystem II stability/assembly factor-like uncharacterized protein